MASTDFENRQRRVFIPGAGAILGCILLLLTPALAQAANFGGAWAVRGMISSPTMVGTVAPVCTFVQGGNAIAGTCKGPNSEGPVSGLASGATIEWEWHMTKRTPIGVSGISEFRGVLGADGVVRGTWKYAGLAPVGTFTAQRVR